MKVTVIASGSKGNSTLVETKSKNILIDANASDIIIDWTGLTDFYARFGFELWESYHYLTKTKKGD